MAKFSFKFFFISFWSFVTDLRCGMRYIFKWKKTFIRPKVMSWPGAGFNSKLQCDAIWIRLHTASLRCTTHLHTGQCILHTATHCTCAHLTANTAHCILHTCTQLQTEHILLHTASCTQLHTTHILQHTASWTVFNETAASYSTLHLATHILQCNTDKFLQCFTLHPWLRISIWKIWFFGFFCWQKIPWCDKCPRV